MKTTTTLLIALGLASSAALGLASSAALAQAQSSPGASGVQADSQAGEQSQYSIGGGPGTPPASQSGPSSNSGTLSPQSGAQSGMPPHPSSGTSGTQSGMPPPASPDASGAQPGMPPSSSGASSMQSPAQSQAGGAPSPVARLQPKTADGVTYICGGVGKEEASYMKREAKKHDMLLTFAGKDGEFLADVNVAIKDAKGNTVLETTCDGPMMLVDLPKGGKYRVHAVANGYPIDQTVTVAKAPGQKRAQQVAAVFLTWPTRVARIDPTEAATATGASGTGGTSRAGGGSGGASGTGGTSRAGGGSGGEKKW